MTAAADEQTIDGEAHEIENAVDAEPEQVPEAVNTPALPPAVREAQATVELERATAQSAGTVLPSPREWEATLAVAQKIAMTPFVPESYRGQPEAVVAAILTGRELGIGPMQALREIHMIDGRATFSATLMLGKLRQGGVEIIESTLDDDRAWIKARRRDTGEVAEVEWRYEEATKIMRKGKALSEGANWKNYRQDMLWARCVGRLARRLGSDLMGGLVYSSEEVEDWDDSEQTYDAATTPTAGYFDPGRDLLGTAIRGAETPKLLGERMEAINGSLDWTALVDAATEHAFGKPRAELTPDETPAFWRRLSNAIAFIDSHNDAPAVGDFPPVADEEIVKGFAWAFGGDYELPLPEKAPQEPDGAEEALDAAMEPLSESDEAIGYPEEEA